MDGAGVGGLDAAGVGGFASVAGNNGDMIIELPSPCWRGAGARIGVCELALRFWGLRWPTTGEAVTEAPEGMVGPAISTSMLPSTPLSMTPTFPLSGTCVLVSCSLAAEAGPTTPLLSSYRTGENRTATLAFLCPGSCAIGGRAKLAREYMYTQELEPD